MTAPKKYTLDLETPPNKRKCGAKRAGKDETCGHPAGYRTEHPGFGLCYRHYGSTPTQVAAAFREKMAYEVAQMALYGDPREVAPQDELLDEVARTAGHVQYLMQKIQSMQEEDLTQVNFKTGEERASVWVGMYRVEREHLVKVCESAIRAGVSERYVKLAEQQGYQLAKAIRDILGRLNLSEAQQQAMPVIVRDVLSSLVQTGDIGKIIDMPTQAEALNAHRTKKALESPPQPE